MSNFIQEMPLGLYLLILFISIVGLIKPDIFVRMIITLGLVLMIFGRLAQ